MALQGIVLVVAQGYNPSHWTNLAKPLAVRIRPLALQGIVLVVVWQDLNPCHTPVVRSSSHEADFIFPGCRESTKTKKKYEEKKKGTILKPPHRKPKISLAAGMNPRRTLSRPLVGKTI